MSGENKSKPVIRVDRLELLGSKKDSFVSGVSNNQQSMNNQNHEDIPF